MTKKKDRIKQSFGNNWIAIVHRKQQNNEVSIKWFW